MPKRRYQLISVDFQDQHWGEFAICPSAQDKIKHYLNQAMAKHTITDERERSIAERALRAAAIEMAHEEGTKEVRIAHIKRGWREMLRSAEPLVMCPRPRHCLQRSVIERVDEIKERSQVFRQMMSEIE